MYDETYGNEDYWEIHEGEELLIEVELDDITD